MMVYQSIDLLDNRERGFMKKDYIFIGLVCLLIGFVIAQQAKIVQKDMLKGMSPREKSSELAGEIQKIQEEKKVLLEHIGILEKKIQDIEASESKENVLIQSLNDELRRYKLFSGFSDVTGPGVVISVDNPPVDMNYAYEVNFVYDYELLLSLINELNAAGAEAISINGQRITGMSEIRTAGSMININMIPQQAPFVIEAIGNSDTLDGAINQRFGIVSQIREKRYLVEVRKSNDVKIKKFNGVLTFKYAHEIQ